MADTQPLYGVVRRFAATMLRAFEINDVLYEFCDHAVNTLEAEGAGVSVGVGGQLHFVTATSEKVFEIEHAQEAQLAGPCTEASNTGEIFPVTDIAQLTEWPLYRSAADASGFVSVVGIPLAVGDHRVGSLNVYDTKRRNWTESDLEAARVLADIATAHLVHSGELAESRQLSEQLQHALDSRIIIEQAKGMLARDHDTTVDRAFELLRKQARSRGASLRDLAEAVVNLGLQLPSGD